MTIAIDSTTRKLQFVLAESSSAGAVVSIVTFFRQTANSEQPIRAGIQVAASNHITDVDALDLPAQNETKVVANWNLYNGDNVDHTVSALLDDNGTNRLLKKKLLAAGEALTYEDGAGWDIL